MKLTGLLLVFASLMPLVTAQTTVFDAQSLGVNYVSDNLDADTWFAQRFTTGVEAAIMGEVRVLLASAVDFSLELEIWSQQPTGDLPHAQVGLDFGSVGSLNGAGEYAISGSHALAAETTYWLLFKGAGGEGNLSAAEASSGGTGEWLDAADYRIGLYDQGGWLSASGYVANISLTTAATAVPEPSTYALLAGLGVLGVVVMRRRASKEHHTYSHKVPHIAGCSHGGSTSEYAAYPGRLIKAPQLFCEHVIHKSSALEFTKLTIMRSICLPRFSRLMGLVAGTLSFLFQHAFAQPSATFSGTISSITHSGFSGGVSLDDSVQVGGVLTFHYTYESPGTDTISGDSVGGYQFPAGYHAVSIGDYAWSGTGLSIEILNNYGDYVDGFTIGSATVTATGYGFTAGTSAALQTLQTTYFSDDELTNLWQLFDLDGFDYNNHMVLQLTAGETGNFRTSISASIHQYDFSAPSIPEPSAFIAIVGVITLGFVWRRKRSHQTRAAETNFKYES